MLGDSQDLPLATARSMRSWFEALSSSQLLASAFVTGVKARTTHQPIESEDRWQDRGLQEPVGHLLDLEGLLRNAVTMVILLMPGWIQIEYCSLGRGANRTTDGSV
jgi:hypothetical protein